jgi:hypothetical protein
MASHTHAGLPTFQNTGATGTAQTVILTTTGNSAGYTGGGGVYGILNPYYSLAYIMKS